MRPAQVLFSFLAILLSVSLMSSCNRDEASGGDGSQGSHIPDDAPNWEPSAVVPVGVHPPVRGRTLLRGIIHIHSVYSHDACDYRPWIQGEPNWDCYDQLREAICTTNQQFVMLTDHADNFSWHEFPDVLLYQPDEGDELIFQDSAPIGNILHCEDGNTTIITAGNENALMPLGLKRMPQGSPEEREQFLRGRGLGTVDGMHELGAKVFVPHAEGWETHEIGVLPVDGIEIYNLHANIDPGIREEDLGLPGLGFLPDLCNLLLPFKDAAHSDLFLLSFLWENRPDLDHWDRLLSTRRVAGIMATDAHRNTLPIPLLDQDRADSYRRMMRWFANYVLVRSQDLHEIEAAMAHGRMYGAFQVFGEPVGFDFYAETGNGYYDMGDEVALTDGPVLHLTVPAFYRMDPKLDPPDLRLLIVRSGEQGGTVVLQGSNEDLHFTVSEAGAYRAEIRIVPFHLEPWLGDDPEPFFREYPLIYANPIYVTD